MRSPFLWLLILAGLVALAILLTSPPPTAPVATHTATTRPVPAPHPKLSPATAPSLAPPSTPTTSDELRRLEPDAPDAPANVYDLEQMRQPGSPLLNAVQAVVGECIGDWPFVDPRLFHMRQLHLELTVPPNPSGTSRFTDTTMQVQTRDDVVISNPFFSSCVTLGLEEVGLQLPLGTTTTRRIRIDMALDDIDLEQVFDDLLAHPARLDDLDMTTEQVLALRDQVRDEGDAFPREP